MIERLLKSAKTVRDCLCERGLRSLFKWVNCVCVCTSKRGKARETVGMGITVIQLEGAFQGEK